MTDKCPACGLDKGYFKDDVIQPCKSQCKGCGTVFYNREKRGNNGNTKQINGKSK